jgi:hypothetical protein
LAICEQGCGEALNHGKCVLPGQCQCSGQWYGPSCQHEICPNSCSNHGFCNGLNCECNENFGGPDCGVHLGCSDECDTHGTCVGTACVCDPGFTGTSCQNQQCPHNCSGRGECSNKGLCQCYPGFGGEDGACSRVTNQAVCMASCTTQCEAMVAGQTTNSIAVQQAKAQHMTKDQCVNLCVPSTCIDIEYDSLATGEKVQSAVNTAKKSLAEIGSSGAIPPADRFSDSAHRSIWW